MKEVGTKNSGASRREEIIRIAARLFAEKGYYATKLDEIAEEMGLSKPALYYYIDNKEELLRIIIEMMMKRAKKVAAVGRLKLPPREKLAKMIRMIVEFATNDKEIAIIALEQSKNLPKRDRDSLRRHEKEINDAVQQTFKDGIDQGLFAVDDVRMASFAILGVTNWCYRWYKSGAGLKPAQIADQFIKLLENGYIRNDALKCPALSPI